MELKVWVEGIQRVVCGITEQTTVQEVVIALAQATGRTGRYTLVEKWRDTEKLLPPSECPVKVLEKFGEYAAEVEFLLKRTGASMTSSDVETVKGPERNIYRQSLPPLIKSRDKSEILQALKRKEPKRKSLTITGSARTHCTEDVVAKPNKNNNANNNTVQMENTHVAQGAIRSLQNKEKTRPKPDFNMKDKDRRENTAAQIPRSILNNPNMPKPEAASRSSSTATRALFPMDSQSEVVAKSPTRKNDIVIKNVKASKKVPLMQTSSKISDFSRSQHSVSGYTSKPYHSRNLSPGSQTPNRFLLSNENKTKCTYRHGNSLPRSQKKMWSVDPNTTNDKKQPVGVKMVPLMPPNRKGAAAPNTQGHSDCFHSNKDCLSAPTMKGREGTKAGGDFWRLIKEQQKHLEEQQDTIYALEKEIRNILDQLQYNEKAINDEIAVLNERTYVLEQQCSDGQDIVLELSAEDVKVSTFQRNMDALRERVQLSSEKLGCYRRKLSDLKQTINEESHLQIMMEEKRIEIAKHMVVQNKTDIGHIHRKLAAVKDEICRLEKSSDVVQKEIESKQAKFEALSRELRQVNLQHFIRRTGSKVTVLPPSREDVEAEGQLRQNFYHAKPLNVSGLSSPVAPTPPEEGYAEGVWV